MISIPDTFACPADIKKAMPLAIEGMRRHGVLSEACRGSGIGRSTLYKMMREMPDFKKQMKHAHQENLDELERAMRERAKHPRGDLAGIFILKHNREKYREVQRVELTGKDGAPVAYTDAKSELLQRLAAVQKRGAIDVQAVGSGGAGGGNLGEVGLSGAGRNLQIERGQHAEKVRQQITKVGEGKVKNSRK